jgi:uncharacterized caspase-like protein
MKVASALVLSVVLGAGCAHADLRARGFRPASSTAGELAQALEPRRVAVLIGVDEYDSAAFQDLEFAAGDAAAMSALFDDPDLGGFDRTILLNTRRTTSREAVMRELRSIRSDLMPEDVFVLYFSGHGTLAKGEDGSGRLYLLPADADPGALDDTALELDALRDFFGRLAPQRKAFVVDACFHGRGKSVLNPDLNADVSTLLATTQQSALRGLGSGEAHLFASTLGRPAFEDRTLGHGVYTHHLLQAMSWARSEADLDGDGVVTAWEVHDYARRRTAEHTDSIQIPEASLRVVGDNDLVFSGELDERSRRDRALVYDYHGRNHFAGATLIIDGRSKGTFPGTHLIEAGNRRVEVRAADGEILLEGRADFGAGESVALADLSVKVREDRGMQAVRVGGGGGPASIWGTLWGDGFIALESWTAIRKPRAPVRGLYAAGSIGIGVSPTRQDLDRLLRQGRAVFWLGAEVGMSRDVNRLRLRVGWHFRGTLLPPAKVATAGPLRPEESGWIFGSMGPVGAVGVILSRRASFVVSGSLQGTPLDTNGSGVAVVPFGTVTAGLELGF